MTFINQTVIFTIVIILLVCSIACQIIIGVFYQNMIKATESMITTDNKLLKQCKQKFIQCYRTNGKVANIPVFVDKFLNKMKILRVTIRGIRHLSGQLMLFAVLVSGFGICKGIIEGERIRNLFPYYILSFMGLYIYFCIASAVDIQGSRQIIKINLIDYLENHVSVRLQTGIRDRNNLENNSKADDVEEVNEKEDEASLTFTKENAMELEDLLKAFLT